MEAQEGPPLTAHFEPKLCLMLSSLLNLQALSRQLENGLLRGHSCLGVGRAPTNALAKNYAHLLLIVCVAFQYIYKRQMLSKDILADLDGLNDDDQMPDVEVQQQNEVISDEQQRVHQQLNAEESDLTTITAKRHSRLLTVNRAKFLQHISQIREKLDETIAKNEVVKQQCIGKYQKQRINEYINKSNYYALQISKETAAIAKFIKKIYYKKIPQLESIVTNDGLYCKAVVEIEEEQGGKMVNQGESQKGMFSYLSSHQRISLKISISSPTDQLPKQEQQEVLAAAHSVLELQLHHQVLIMYLETCMNLVAPNLCQLLGSLAASELVATAGGIDKLAAMPACNIQVMGGSRSAQVGLSQLERNHTGIFGQMKAVKQAPKKFQMQLVRMLATNAAKCARADALGSSGGQGARLHDELYERFEKIQEEGGLTHQEKPLEIPDLKPRRKRGGKRHRKNKELYEMSELRKQQNRLKFGEEAEEELDEEGEGLGMLRSGVGRLNVGVKKQKVRVSKKMEKRVNKKSGMESSFDIGASQGIELVNPVVEEERGTQSYFAREAGFRTVINNKIGK